MSFLRSAARRLRLFLRSELDLSKDRLLAELRKDELTEDARVAAMKRLGWKFDRERPLDNVVGLGIAFDPIVHRHWIDGLPYLATLVLECGAEIHQLEDRRLELKIGNIRVTPNSEQELGFLVEVLRDEEYLVESGTPMFVWDVGANVGFASLFFAAVQGWDVMAYELCPPTAEIARENVRRSGLEDRIQINAAGIGGKAETAKIAYSAKFHGTNSMVGDTLRLPTGDEQELDVQVLDASEVFTEVQERAAGRPIFVKLDCEGAEYAVLKRLHETGQLAMISAMVIEAHCHPGLEPDDAVKTLLAAGFLVRRKRRLNLPYETFYASRLAN